MVGQVVKEVSQVLSNLGMIIWVKLERNHGFQSKTVSGVGTIALVPQVFECHGLGDQEVSQSAVVAAPN